MVRERWTLPDGMRFSDGRSAAADRGVANVPAASRLEGLDALRGLCALIVVFGHAAALANQTSLFIRMHLAVDLFFMLSGYVMARSYEDRLAGGMRAGSFIKARIGRLWPTMAIGAFLGFALVLSWQYPIAALFLLVCTLLFIPVLRGEHNVFLGNSPTWSIFFELLANLTHAALLRRLRLPGLFAVVITCAGLLIFLQRAPNPGATAHEFALGFPRAIGTYTFGIILWRVLRDRALLPMWPVLLGLPALMVLSHFWPNELWIDWLFAFVLAPICIAFSLGEPPLKRLFAFLGALSFPLYAVHGPILHFMAVQGFGMIPSITLAVLAAYFTMRLTAAIRLPARHRTDPQGQTLAPASLPPA